MLKRGFIIIGGLFFFWQLLIWLFHLPPFILPGPSLVIKTLLQEWRVILHQTWITVFETVMGLFLGTVFGIGTALGMAFFKPLRLWMMPILLCSQAIPIFAIAPLLVLWLGYGMAAKIFTTLLMLFFPITNAFYDGLARTHSGWLDLAQTMNANRWNIFWHIRIPAALPALASGLRVATAVAPIGAVIGEWVGSSNGLGFLILNANARMQIDLMFAALFVLISFSLILYFTMNHLLARALPWQQFNNSIQ